MDSATMQVEQEPTLRDYLNIVLDRWWLITATTAAALIASLVFSLTAPPVYRGTASVVVDRSGSSFGLLSDITGISEVTFVDTLAEIVKSRSVAEAALIRLGGSPADREEALKRLQSGLRVQRVRGADVIRIEAEGPTSEAAAAATNAVAEALMAWHVDARRSQASAGREFIEGQLSTVGRELQTAEDALAAYRARDGQVSLSEQTTLAVTKLADFEAQRRASAAERQATEASLRQAQATLAGQTPTMPSSFVMSEDPVAVQLRQQLATFEVELAGLREQFTESHPQVIAAKAKIEETKARLRRLAALRLVSQTITPNPIHQGLASQIIRLEVDREALRAREAALAGVVQRYARDAQQLPAREVTLARLTRDVKVAEQTYLLLSGKLQEARIAEASIVGDLRIVDRAIPPSAPVRPRPRTNALFGALLGLMLGAVAALLLEALDAMDSTIKTPEQAGQVLNLPVLGVVPLWVPADRKKSQQEVLLVTVEHRRSPFAEAFRRVRTNLLYLSPDRPLRRIQVTSPGPGEGKSTVAANLAISLSQAGRRVWLVECNLRRPSLSWAFQPATPAGLSELLADGMSVEQVVHSTRVDNLWFVPSGTRPPNPAELLGSQKMRMLLDQQTDGAEVVVLDTPPVLPVADAVVLAPAVDGVILVVQIGKTPCSVARRAREHLEAVGARVIGVVANGMPPGRRGSYYYYSHSYQSEAEEPSKQTAPPG